MHFEFPIRCWGLLAPGYNVWDTDVTICQFYVLLLWLKSFKRIHFTYEYEYLSLYCNLSSSAGLRYVWNRLKQGESMRKGTPWCQSITAYMIKHSDTLLAIYEHHYTWTSCFEGNQSTTESCVVIEKACKLHERPDSQEVKRCSLNYVLMMAANSQLTDSEYFRFE